MTVWMFSYVCLWKVTVNTCLLRCTQTHLSEVENPVFAKMNRLILQQWPSTSADVEACTPMRPRRMKLATQPGHRLPLSKQANDMCYWQPYSFQTQYPEFEQLDTSPNAFPKRLTCEEGPLPIQDPAAMVHVYEKAFKNLQQTNCRILAKAYIKILEPRKQVNYPYNGRKSVGGRKVQLDPEVTKPSWWPSRVRHHEPDHLPKVGMSALHRQPPVRR
jgi:hypothetical protein